MSGFEFKVTQPHQDPPAESLDLAPLKTPSEVKEGDDIPFTQEELWGHELYTDYNQITKRKKRFEYFIEVYANRLMRFQYKWNRMIVGLVNDEKFGPIIDGWAKGDRSLDQQLIPERYQELKTLFGDEVPINRALTLDALLNATNTLFENEKRTSEEQETLQTLNEYWITLYTHWEKLRLQQLQHLAQECAPYIEKTKKEVVDFCMEEFPDFVTKEGAQRVFSVPVMIQNEFHLWEEKNHSAGCYWGSSPGFGQRIVLLERYARLGAKDPEFGYSFMGHEAIHALSGHGPEEKREKSDIGANDHRSDVMSNRRVGVGLFRKYYWLNEALTERLAIRFTEKKFGKKHESHAYVFERSLFEHLIKAYNIDEKGLYGWYFAEDDDTDAVRLLSIQYPNLLPTLEALELEFEKQVGVDMEMLSREQRAKNQKVFFDTIDSAQERNNIKNLRGMLKGIDTNIERI